MEAQGLILCVFGLKTHIWSVFAVLHLRAVQEAVEFYSFIVGHGKSFDTS